MDNTLTYILELQGNIDEKLRAIGIANEQQLDTWSRVQKQVNAANSTMSNMGRSVGSLTERINALRAQREWIPAENTVAIRAINNEIRTLETDINRLNSLNGGKLSKWWNDLKTSMPFRLMTNPLLLAGVAVSKLNRHIGESQRVFMEAGAQVTKLNTVMQNTIGARQDEINSILELASAQEKLGVISRSVQVAGAQELATYVTKTESLKGLLPVMNDMLAQQYGLNATQQQATTIASMLGKVMDGQVGALSRYGYRFDENQEKLLRFGTEAQRVATIIEVVTDSVGGVNAALAQTPEGKLKQAANNVLSLQERVGKLVVQVKAVFLPFQEALVGLLEKTVSFFEKLGGFIYKHKTVFTLLGIAIGVVTSALILYYTWQKIIAAKTVIMTFLKSGEAAAWWAATAPMMLTIGIIAGIIAAITAVVLAIIYCIRHVTGWGETWNNAMAFMRLGIELFRERVALSWLKIKNTFITGFEIIEKGWHKLQSLWNKDGAQAALARIEQNRNERAQEIAAAQGKVEALNKQLSEMTVFALKTNGTSIGEFLGSGLDRVKSRFGLNDNLQNAVNTGRGNTGTGIGTASNTAIATGGTRNTTININGIKMIETLIMQGTVGENAQEIERSLAESMYRILGMAEVSAGN